MTDEAVKVVVRCRPMNSKETSEGRKSSVEVNVPSSMVTITNPDLNAISLDPKSFTFDAVYDETSTQRAVYDETAYPLVESVLSGYNGTIFAYGQTGCGKTHTMQGKPDPPELRGIIPNSFDHIFDAIKLARDKEFLVRCSYLEIYNEEIRDLLGSDHTSKMELHEDPDRGVFVKDLTQVVVDSGQAIDKVMQDGNRHRTTGATLMNDQSSRSHSIFTIIIEMSRMDAEDSREHITRGKLNLVDLAGSERPSKTGATGTRMKEGIKINLSLTALGNVISALVEGATKTRHIPYRDSKLTRLLQDSLGGNTKTVMVAAIGPADYNYDETLSTLRYANRAKNIKNKPIINEDPKDALLRQYKDEIERLRTLLVQHLSAAGLDTAALNAILAQAGAMGAAMAGGGGGGALKPLPNNRALPASLNTNSASSSSLNGNTLGGSGSSNVSATPTPKRSGGRDDTEDQTPGTLDTATTGSHSTKDDSFVPNAIDEGITIPKTVEAGSTNEDGTPQTNNGSTDENQSNPPPPRTPVRPLTPNGSSSGTALSSSPSLNDVSRPLLDIKNSPRAAAAVAAAMSPNPSFRTHSSTSSSSTNPVSTVNTALLGAEAQEAIEAARRDAERERKEREELARKLLALQQMVVGSSNGSKTSGTGNNGTLGGGDKKTFASGNLSSLTTNRTKDDDPELAQALARDEQRREQNKAAKAQKLATSPAHNNNPNPSGDFDDNGMDDDNDEPNGTNGTNLNPTLDSNGTLTSADRAKLTRAEKEKIVKKVKSKYTARMEALKRELLDLQDEHAQQRESLMATVREQAKEAKLLEALVSLFLSPLEVSKVWERAVWNEETEEWTLPRVKPRQGYQMRNKTINQSRNPPPARNPGTVNGTGGAVRGTNRGGTTTGSTNNNHRSVTTTGSSGSISNGGNDSDTEARITAGNSILASDPGSTMDTNSIHSTDNDNYDGTNGNPNYTSSNGNFRYASYAAYENGEEEDNDEEGGAVISDGEIDNTNKKVTSMPRLKNSNGNNNNNGGNLNRGSGNDTISTSLPSLSTGGSTGTYGGSSNGSSKNKGLVAGSSNENSLPSLPMLNNSNGYNNPGNNGNGSNGNPGFFMLPGLVPGGFNGQRINFALSIPGMNNIVFNPNLMNIPPLMGGNSNNGLPSLFPNLNGNNNNGGGGSGGNSTLLPGIKGLPNNMNSSSNSNGMMMPPLRNGGPPLMNMYDPSLMGSTGNPNSMLPPVLRRPGSGSSSNNNNGGGGGLSSSSTNYGGSLPMIGSSSGGGGGGGGNLPSLVNNRTGLSSRGSDEGGRNGSSNSLKQSSSSKGGSSSSGGGGSMPKINGGGGGNRSTSNPKSSGSSFGSLPAIM